MIALVASAVSLAAATALLRQPAEFVSPEQDRLLLAVAVVAVAGAWVLTHTAFTLHYAHLYYREAQTAGGLAFDDAPPDDLDFAYFAFTIGMTYQTADVTVTRRALRGRCSATACSPSSTTPSSWPWPSTSCSAASSEVARSRLGARPSPILREGKTRHHQLARAGCGAMRGGRPGPAGRTSLDGSSGRRRGERHPGTSPGPEPSRPGTAARVWRRDRRSSGRDDPRRPRRPAPRATGCARWTVFYPPQVSRHARLGRGSSSSSGRRRWAPRQGRRPSPRGRAHRAPSSRETPAVLGWRA